MGLFSRDYNRPGPGIPKDIPRKKGIARFFELFFRDFFDYVKMSLLFCLSLVPSVAAFIFGTLPFLMGEGGMYLLPLILSLILAFPVGGVITACYFNITRFMRDDPSYLWFDFKRKFKENYKQAAMPGIFCTMFIYMQVLLWVQLYYQLITETYSGDLIWLILAVVSLLLFSMITPYLFLHYAYVDLKSSRILRNSFLMAFAYLPRSFMGAICGGFIWIIIALFFPASFAIFPLIPIILVSLSMLLTLMWIWPPFNKNFDVENEILRRRAERAANEEGTSEANEVFTDKA